MQDRIISALIGLAGACNNNGKTQHTDTIVMQALLQLEGDANTEDIVSRIQKEKYTISPGCETCQNPCGNTSDYDMQKFYENQELKPIKKALLTATIALAHRLHQTDQIQLPEEIYRAISFLGYELAEASYQGLICKLNDIAK